jgi:hypothetical protein
MHTKLYIYISREVILDLIPSTKKKGTRNSNVFKMEFL